MRKRIPTVCLFEIYFMLKCKMHIQGYCINKYISLLLLKHMNLWGKNMATFNCPQQDHTSVSGQHVREDINATEIARRTWCIFKCHMIISPESHLGNSVS